MARSKDDRAATELGNNLRRLHGRKGNPAMSEIEHYLYGRGLAIDRETLRLYHNGKRDPKSLDIGVAVALADYYGVEVEKLHPSLRARAESTGAVLARFATAVGQIIVSKRDRSISNLTSHAA